MYIDPSLGLSDPSRRTKAGYPIHFLPGLRHRVWDHDWGISKSCLWATREHGLYAGRRGCSRAWLERGQVIKMGGSGFSGWSIIGEWLGMPGKHGENWSRWSQHEAGLFEASPKKRCAGLTDSHTPRVRRTVACRRRRGGYDVEGPKDRHRRLP